MSRLLFRLKSRHALKVQLAGGKGVGLAKLSRLGYRVPPGIILSTHVFQEIILNFTEELSTQRTDSGEIKLEEIRQRILDFEFPSRLKGIIFKAYSKIGGRVAVRSSMVGEDSESSSFAGQLDTVLDVEGEEDVLHAVKKCLSSVFNWRLWKYFETQKSLSPQHYIHNLSLAILIQKMVDAHAAGVAFSCDPMTGQNHVIIEAAKGSGERIVRGLVEPDRYAVDERGELVNFSLKKPGSLILESSQILAMASTVREIASKMGGAQDVEWVYDGTYFYFLQSRPITSITKKRIYSCKMISDMSPGLIKPLVWSTKTVAMAERVFGRMFSAILGPTEVEFSKLLTRIHSRIYADVTLLGELLERSGLPSNFFEVVSRDECATKSKRRFTLRNLPVFIRFVKFTWKHCRRSNKIVQFIESQKKILEPFRQKDWSSEESHELIANIQKLVDLHAVSQWNVIVASLNMMIRNKLIAKMVQKKAPGVIPNDLLRGYGGQKSLEPNHIIQNIASQAQMLDPEVLTIFAEEDDESIRRYLSSTEKGQQILEEMGKFLDRFGFLSPNGSDFTEVPWIEDPYLIWRSIGRSITKADTQQRTKSEEIRKNALMKVRKNMNGMHWMILKKLLDSTEKYMDLRERVSLIMSEESYLMRSIFLALSDKFKRIGAMDARDDIFYLYFDEVQRLAGGDLAPREAKDLIKQRKTEMDEDAMIELPDTITDGTEPVPPVIDQESKDCLVGIGSSKGFAHGYAVVLQHPSDLAQQLDQNAILVVPFTDVGWAPLLPGIGGIVAETGGQLSHTSIIAREYAIPAVVSVRKARHFIKDGQPLTVDGYSGRVYLKHFMSPEEGE